VSGAMVLPWSAVAHDNHRLMPARGRLIASGKYRATKRTAELLLTAQWKAAPLTGAVEVRAVAYFPDRRKRDAGNYRKLITDALTGIAYADDAQVWREVWERGGVDKANPRIELTVRPLGRDN
jgi:Holliday junction resolvase RusA-like endonuclease